MLVLPQQLEKCVFERVPYAFVGHDRPPPYYSNLTTLDPDHTYAIPQELARFALKFGGVLGLKDSFCLLELEKNGFETLFEAS